jgi:hypothetical protein
MAYSGLTVDSTTNGVDFVASAKTGLTATIANEVLQLSGGSARLNGGIAISKSSISCYDPLADNGGNRGPSALLGYSTNNTITGTSPRVTLAGSSLAVETVTGRKSGLLISDVIDSLITETGPGGLLIIRVQPGCAFVNSIFEGIEVIEFAGAIAQFFGVSIRNSRYGILNWEAGRLDFVGISIPSSTSGYLAALGDGPSGATNTNQLHFWNPVALDFTKLLLTNDGSKAFQGSTVSWRIKDTSPVQNALVIYRDDRASIGGAKSEIARYVTNSSGILTGTVNSQTGASGSDTARPTLWVRNKQTRLTGSTQAQSPQVVYTFWNVGGQYGERLYAVDTVSSEIEIRSYLHLKPDLVMSPSSEIGKIKADGSVDFYADFVLAVDAGVTITNATTVGTYSGITNATGAITLSGTLTLSQAYDSRKLYWRNNDGVSCPVQDGFTADFGSASITLSAAANNPAATAKYTAAATSGSLTLSAAGNYSSTPWIRPSGSVTTVAPGSTNLAGWALTGSTINVSSSTATVTVSSLSGITAGSGVTLITPPITLTAPNLTSVAFNRVQCRVSLVPGGPISYNNSTGARVSGGNLFASGDVNLSANTITIAGVAGKITTNSPIRVGGSDLPVPLDLRAVYYPSSAYAGGNAIPLSGTPGGSTIDLIDTGTGSDRWLEVWTELATPLVISGALSVDLTGSASSAGVTLSNGDFIVLQAAHWKGNPQSQVPCTASEYFQQTFQYAGNNLSTLESLASADLHNQFCVIRAKDGSQVTDFILDSSAPGKIQLDTSVVAFSTYDAALFFYFARSSVAGLRLLRNNIQILGLNEIRVIGELTIEAQVRAVGSGPFTYRADGQFISADESKQIDWLWSNTVGVPVVTEVPVDLSQDVMNTLAAIAAAVAVPSTGSGLDAAGVRSAIGLASANLDTQLDNLPTVVELNGRSLPSADLMAIKTQTDKFVFTTTGRVDATAIGVPTTDNTAAIAAIKAKTDQFAFTTANRVDSSVIDKSGFSLSSSQSFNLTGNITGSVSGSVGSVTSAVTLPVIPTDWISAASVSAAAVSKIQAGLSTYAGGDTPGTSTLLSRISGNVLLASGYTAPDNTAIAAIKAKTDQLVFSTANRIDATAIGVPTNPLLASDSRLNNLDAAVSTRMATFTYTTPPTVAQIWTGFTSGAVAANLITQFQSGLFQSSGYTAPNNAGILAAIAALPQDKVGYSLTALPTPPSDWLSAAAVSAAAVTKIQTGLSTYAGGDTPGTSTLLSRVPGTVLLASAYTAPDNTAIANINARTARLDGLLINPGSGDRFSATALSNAPIGSSISAADVWAYSDRSLSAGGGTAIAQAVWNFSTGSITVPGNAGRQLNRLAKVHGLTAASVTASGSARTTSDGAIAQAITTNPDGSKTMSGAE